MAHFIADRLDYMHSDVFVTPFGGGCRVLLNKPRHPIEIYNDFSSGLCALMRVLSQRDTAIELIQRVMDSEYSREQFEDAKELFDRSGDVKEYTWKKIMDCLARKFPQMDRRSLPRLFDYGIAVEDLQKPNEELKRRWDILIEAKKKDSLFKNELDSLLKDWILISDAEKEMEPETLLEGEELKAPRKLAAIQQGKDIYAVPGRICDALSYGTNCLIQQGAGVFLNMEDFLREMHIFAESGENSSLKQKNHLENLERLVYSCLDLSPRSIEELLKETGMPLGALMENLETLQEKGCVSEIYRNYYIRSDVSV